MKFLAIAATLMLSASAFAVSQGSSWGEIFAANNVGLTPQVGLLGGVSLDNTCLTQDSVKSKTAVPVCFEYGPVPGIGAGEAPGYGAGAPCLKPGKAVVSGPRTTTSSVCLASSGSGELYPECTKWGQQTTRIPDVVNVSVYDYNTGAEFVKAYAIPACAN